MAQRMLLNRRIKKWAAAGTMWWSGSNQAMSMDSPPSVCGPETHKRMHFVDVAPHRLGQTLNLPPVGIQRIPTQAWRLLARQTTYRSIRLGVTSRATRSTSHGCVRPRAWRNKASCICASPSCWDVNTIFSGVACHPKRKRAINSALCAGPTFRVCYVKSSVNKKGRLRALDG